MWKHAHTCGYTLANLQVPKSVFTGIQTFNAPISTGVPGAPPPHSVSISVTRPGITVTSSASRPPQGQSAATAVAAGERTVHMCHCGVTNLATFAAIDVV